MELINIYKLAKKSVKEIILLKRFFGAFAWLLGGGSVSTLLMSASSFSIASHLGATFYGVIAMISSTVFLVSGVMQLKTTEALTKFLTDFLESCDYKSAGRLVTIGLLVDFLSAVMASSALIFASSYLVNRFFDHQEYLYWFQLFCLVPIFIFSYPTSLALLRVAGNFAMIAAIDVANSVFTLAGYLYLIFTGASWMEIIVWTVIVAALKGLMLFYSIHYALKQLGFELALRFNARAFILEFNDVVRLMLGSTGVNVIKSAHNHLDVLVVGLFLGPASSGAYKLARNVVQLLGFPTNAMFQISFAEFSKLIAKRRFSELLSLLRLFVRVTLLLALAYCVGIWSLGPWIFSYFSDGSFQEALTVLPTLVAGLSITLVSQYWHATLMALNYAEQVVISMLIALIVQALLLLILIPHFGAIGAAIAFLAYSIIRAVFIHRRFVSHVLKRLPIGSPAAK